MFDNVGDDGEVEQHVLNEKRRRLGAFIRTRRENMRVNRPRFEALHGVNQKFLSSIEGGHTSCSLETLEAIARGLGVPAATLMSVYAGETDDLRNYVLKSVTLPDVLESVDVEKIQIYINDLTAARERANMAENEKLVNSRKDRQAKKLGALRDVKKIETAGAN
jgi:transcriptional regulator with XRE-family HTH domain